MRIKKERGIGVKAKLSLLIFGLGLVLLTTGMNGGCGETVHESSTYYYPNWMPDGRIICAKVTSRWSNTIWGRKELGDTDYITAMNADGSNEQNLFEVNSIATEVTCSPTGELIGYIEWPYSMTISNYSGTNKTVVPNIPNGISYFDWSPDATKIAYSANDKLYIINVNGTNNAQIATSAEAVAWRVGEEVVYVYISGTDYLKIAMINQTGLSNEVFSVIGMDAQNATDKIYFRRVSDKSIRTISTNGTNESLVISNYDHQSLKLSFDNTKIVGGDLITGGGSRIGGIWVTDINNGTSTQIR